MTWSFVNRRRQTRVRRTLGSYTCSLVARILAPGIDAMTFSRRIRRDQLNFQTNAFLTPPPPPPLRRNYPAEPTPFVRLRPGTVL